METVIDAPFALGAVLPREDPRDALICPGVDRISALPHGATVGTVSLRRQAQILAQRPDLRVVPLRGNIGTRLRKVDEGQVGATVLALAGLKRPGIETRASAVLDTAATLPGAAHRATAGEGRAA